MVRRGTILSFFNMLYAVTFFVFFCSTDTAQLYPYTQVIRVGLIQQYVMTEQESHFKNTYYLASDCEIMTNRLALIGPDTPPVEAKHTLPDNILYTIRYQQQFKDYLNSIYPYRHSTDQATIDRILEDLKGRMHVYDMINECGWGLNYRDELGVRLRLQALRDLVGRDNFYNSKWPEPLPDIAKEMYWFVPQEFIEEPE